MEQLDSHEHDLENKYSIEEFREILNGYEKSGATHLQLSYQDYGNPIVNLFEKTEEEEKRDIPVTYSYIKRNIGWSEFCDIAGGNYYAIREFGDYEDSAIFYITESQANKLKI